MFIEYNRWKKQVPLDQETINFLVEETIENGLLDSKEKLNELAKKYKLKIRVKTLALLDVTIGEEGEVIWE